MEQNDEVRMNVSIHILTSGDCKDEAILVNIKGTYPIKNTKMLQMRSEEVRKYVDMSKSCRNTSGGLIAGS
jgi:hypothetical protein